MALPGPQCWYPRLITHFPEFDQVDSFQLALKKSLALVGISLLCLALVFGETKLLFTIGLPQARQTAFFESFPETSHQVNDTIPLEIKVQNISSPINAVQTDISFDPTMLQITDVSTIDSFATIFVDRTIDNTSGTFHLSGGLPNPGFAGPNGLFATVYFRVLQTGVTQVNFLPSSLILANDGYGTNVMKETAPISYLIGPSNDTAANETPAAALVGETSVLGESSNPDQLVFFDETEQVLGDSTELGSQEQKPSLTQRTAEWLRRYNQFVLSLWSKPLAWLKNN